ncbi:MAG: glycosyltransferase [Acidobacteriota bacterium]
MRQPRILHAPRNICNISWVLAQEQREAGYVSHVMKHDDDSIESDADFNLKVHRYTRWSTRYLIYLMFAVRAALRYDIFIFHTGVTLLPYARELPVLKALGKKIYFYFHGRDIRPAGLPDSIRYADHYFVSTPDLLEFAPGASWLPQAIDPRRYPEARPAGIAGDPLRILHGINADTEEKRQRKGTHTILAAVKRLQQKGYRVEPCLSVSRSHDEFVAELIRADIVVDQLVLGWYGVIAIEAMLLGKPVLVYIRNDLKKYLPEGCPLIPTDPGRLENDLEQLIQARDFARHAREGPAFVARHHFPRAIMEKMHAVIFNGE